MSSRVYATGHTQYPLPLIDKSRTSCPGGRFPPGFIHQVTIIAGLNKLYFTYSEMLKSPLCQGSSLGNKSKSHSTILWSIKRLIFKNKRPRHWSYLWLTDTGNNKRPRHWSYRWLTDTGNNKRTRHWSYLWLTDTGNNKRPRHWSYLWLTDTGQAACN